MIAGMKEFTESIKAGQILNQQQAYACFEHLFEVENDEVAITDFLRAHSSGLYTVEETCGFADYLREQAKPCQLEGQNIFDVCGTGGDGKNTINISTLTALVLASMGEKVAKHGNYGASSKVGSSNLLEALKVPLVDSEEQAQAIFSKTGIVFLHAPLWHPKLKKVSALRRKLGFRTVFNLLGPLLNPANPDYQLIGTPSLKTAQLLRDVQFLRNAGKSKTISIISDHNSYDEASLTGSVTIYRNIKELLYTPQDFGVAAIDPVSIELPATIEETVKLSTELLSGSGSVAHQYVVAANVALALQSRYVDVALNELFQTALEAVCSGRAIKVLDALKSFTP